MPRNGETAWRLDEAFRRIDILEKKTEDYPVTKSEMQGLKEDFEGVKRALWAVAVGLVGLMTSVLIATIKFGLGGG